MAINEIKDAEIREYLLGTAAPETVERLDELSFTDDYSERIGAVEHDLVDEYVAGELPVADERAFESHYLRSPRRREKVDVARAFTLYAERSRTSAIQEPRPDGSFWNVFRSLGTAMQFGMAAAGLLLVAVFGWLIFRSSPQFGDAGPVIATDVGSPAPGSPVIAAPTAEPVAQMTPATVESPSTPGLPNPNRTAPEPKPQPAPTQPKRPQPIPAVFTLTPALRGTSFQSVKLPAGPAEFRLRLETESEGPFTAEIVELRGQSRIWAARGLAASGRDDARTASFRVPAGTIGTGEHRVTVFARGSGGQPEKVGDYFFRVAP